MFLRELCNAFDYGRTTRHMNVRREEHICTSLLITKIINLYIKENSFTGYYKGF